MSVFESEMRNGKFVIGECHKCQKTTWPPNDFCSTCFGSLAWREIKEPGTLIEHSLMNDEIFGIVEFEGKIRVMGRISAEHGLREGQKMKIAKCSFNESPEYQFEGI